MKSDRDYLADRIAAALAEYDSLMARCPVNNRKRGQWFGPDDKCPRCKATASETCGLSSAAGHHLASAIRALEPKS